VKPATSREELLGQLAEVGRMAVARGLVLASGGNLSARLPGEDRFLVTGAGTWLDRLTPEDFALLSLDGETLEGPAPSSEWKLHARTYRVRPDVNAVVHLHPQYTVLVDAMGHPIRFVSLDHAFYVHSVGAVPYAPNGSDELADTAAEQARRHDCVVLSHHGCSTVGADVGMAFRRAMNLEEAAIATYRMLACGDSTTAFPAEAYAQLRHA
jgi:L-fuculose-phosphate aldolase